MRKYLLILLSSFISMICIGQGISVSSFKLLDTDLTASTNGTSEIDQNGETSALIKVVTTEMGFTFDGGQLGIVKTIQTPGEIWLYIPRRSQKITIKHPQLGVLRDYFYPIPINGARTYELVLSTGTVQTIVKKARTTQYVVFNLTPTNAIVELNGELLQSNGGIASKMVRFGTYDYQIKAPNYLPQVGKVEVNDPNNKKILNIKLTPNYSSVNINTDEEAEIWINGEKKGKGSWCGNLGAGVYEFESKKPGHRSFTITKDIEVSLTPITVKLDSPRPIFGEANINSNPAGADVYIDGKKAAVTPQIISDIIVGDHELLIRKEGFTDYSNHITIKEGEEFSVNINLVQDTNITISSETAVNNIKKEGLNMEKLSKDVNPTILGAELRPVTDNLKKQLEINYGLQIIKLDKGDLKNAGVPKGFFILKANNRVLNTIEDLQSIVNNILSYNHGELELQGLYPTGKKAYFIVPISRK